MGVKVYGSSDDLIEVEGDLREEFNVYDEDRFLAFSDGTVIKVYYDSEGIWRVHVLAKGTSEYEHKLPEGEEYSEVFEIIGVKITWVVAGKEFVQAKQGTPQGPDR